MLTITATPTNGHSPTTYQTRRYISDGTAMMLEPAGIEPATRVLEVGSGGYNAALG
jgi:protein-L-isoaspartate O-methyltransferase